MKKIFFSAMLILAVLASFLACGKKAEEPVKEEAETPVVEEAKAEPEPVVEEKEAEVVEEEPEEPEKDYSYVQLYLTEINRLYNTAPEGQEGMIYTDENENISVPRIADQFALVNVDGDDIPELAASNSEGPCRDNTFLYTVYNDEITLLESGAAGFDGYSIEISEGNNIIHTGSSMGGFNSDSFKMINHGKLEDVFSSLAIGIYSTGVNTQETKEIESYKINDKEVSKEEYDDQLWKFILEYNPFTDIGYDALNELTYNYKDGYISYDKTKSKTYLTYEEITAELTKLRNEEDAEKYKDVEPWKVAYRNLLYDFMSGKKISEYEDGYNDESRFMIKDINDDNNLELLINPFSNRWYVYDNKTASLNDYIVGAACGYDPDSEMFICVLGEGERSQILNIQSYDGKGTILWSDDWDDGDFSYREDGINSLEDFLAGTRDYSIWEYQKDDYENSKNRVPSQEEAKNLIEKYVMKEYPISGDVKEINTKNIEAIMDDSVNDNSRDKTDGSLYTVEVTAPDGYVNFRTGAGTDYEIISPISNGETLSVISDEGKWMQVEYQGKTGWVASSQVTKK